MSLLLTCEQVAGLLEDYLEGRLPLGQLLQVKWHLLHCPECRALLATLRVLPDILKESLGPEPEFEVSARAALQGALARLGQQGPRPWPASPVPEPAQTLLDCNPDLPMKILASTHQNLGRERSPRSFPDHLPEATLAQLPPPAQWQWQRDPDGLERAELLADPIGGQRLSLVHAPAGARLASHRHLGSESILVLEGAMEDQGVRWAAGSWHHHGRGSSHGPRILEAGCWYLVRQEGAVRFRGPAGWLRNLRAAG